MVDHPMYDVIFDTDPGIDDAMALLLLHALPEVNLLGITTVFGNASIENCTRNALYICERFNLPYPVYQGAGKTFLGQYETEYPDFVHGKDGLGDIGFEFPARQAESESAADFIVRSVQERCDTSCEVTFATATNVTRPEVSSPNHPFEKACLAFPSKSASDQLENSNPPGTHHSPVRAELLYTRVSLSSK